MTESAEERTRRKFLAHFDQHEWQYQIIVFLRSPDDIEDAAELFAKARKHFARKNPNHPILWRTGVKGVIPHQVFPTYKTKERIINMPFLTLITTKEFDHTKAVAQFDGLSVVGRLDIRQRVFAESKRTSYRKAVQKQKSHDLKAVFGDRKINRFGMLNSNHI